MGTLLPAPISYTRIRVFRCPPSEIAHVIRIRCVVRPNCYLRTIKKHRQRVLLQAVNGRFEKTQKPNTRPTRLAFSLVKL